LDCDKLFPDWESDLVGLDFRLGLLPEGPELPVSWAISAQCSQ